MLEFTQTARETILAFIREGYLEKPALRIAVRDSSPLAPDYELALIEEDEAEQGDVLFENDGIRVYVAADSEALLDGSIVDYLERDGESGFDIRNPNIKPIGSEPPTGELAERVQQVIEERVNPGVASHGGKVTLVEVRDDVAYITMSGGCQGCGLAAVTLRQGIEKMIRQAVPEIIGVADATNHAAGQNPFYAGSP